MDELPLDIRGVLASQWTAEEMLALFQDENIYRAYRQYIPMILNKPNKRYIGVYLMFGGGYSSRDFSEANYDILADGDSPGSTMTCNIVGVYDNFQEALLETCSFIAGTFGDDEDPDKLLALPLRELYDNYGARILEEQERNNFRVINP